MLRKKNYRRNRSAGKISGYINGQALGTVSQCRYGLCSMSFNGCEVIAVYNALIYLGKSVPLPDIALYMERCRVLIGFFGCNIFRSGKILAHFGAHSRRCKAPGEADAFIMSYWTGRRLLSSIHTVFCIRTENGIEVFNSYNICPHTEICPTWESICGKGRPIVIYTISAEKQE